MLSCSINLISYSPRTPSNRSCLIVKKSKKLVRKGQDRRLVDLFCFNNETFTNLITYSTGAYSNPVSIIVVDFNYDNLWDIAVINSDTNIIDIFIGYGNGSFANQISYLVGYGDRPNSIVFGDFNNDRWMDIDVANYSRVSIEILVNCPSS